jgi:hypothetical protein
MGEYDLPTWRHTFLRARDDLDLARRAANGSEAWLRSDWRPVGTELTDAEADALVVAVRVCGQIKALVDEARTAIGGALDG